MKKLRGECVRLAEDNTKLADEVQEDAATVEELRASVAAHEEANEKLRQQVKA